MTMAVEDRRRPPRVPYEMMIRVDAERLAVGDFLPMQGRVVVAVTAKGGTDRIAVETAALFGRSPTRTYLWPRKTPVMMLPGQ